MEVKMKGRGIQGWEDEDTEGPKNGKDIEILELAEEVEHRKKGKWKVEGNGEMHGAKPGLSMRTPLLDCTNCHVFSGEMLCKLLIKV